MTEKITYCLRGETCVYKLIRVGVCHREPSLIAVNDAGRYAGLSVATEEFPVIVDLNSCPYQSVVKPKKGRRGLIM